MTRRKLLALVGSGGLGLAGAAAAIAVQRTRRGNFKTQADPVKLETVTLTIHGMI